MQNPSDNVSENPQQEGGRISKEQVQGLMVLIQGVQLAQKRGAYSLEEAEKLSLSVKQFIVNDESNAENKQGGVPAQGQSQQLGEGQGQMLENNNSL